MAHHGGSAARAATLELSWQLAGTAGRAEYLETTASVLQQLLAADVIGWNAAVLTTGRFEVLPFPVGDWSAVALTRGLAEVADEHPVLLSYLGDMARGDGSPRRLSDVATRDELLRNRAYVDYLRPNGAHHQISALAAPLTPVDGRVWAANRVGSDFTDDELDLLTALQPLLVLLERTVGEVAPAGATALAGAERVRLTPRELEVLRLVAAGLAAGAVARLLRVSERTVHKHLQNGYAKLGVHDRVTAVARARRLGLLG